MTTLNAFKALRASVAAEVQTELVSLFTSDPESSFQRMVDIAAEKGVTLTVDEVKGFLKQRMKTVSLTILSLTRLLLLPLLVVAEVGEMAAAKRKRMTSPGVVAPACVRCASGYSVGSLSLKLKSWIEPSPDGLDSGPLTQKWGKGQSARKKARFHPRLSSTCRCCRTLGHHRGRLTQRKL